MLFYKSTKTIKNNKLTTVATLLFSALFLSAPAVAGTAWEQTTATSDNYDFAINDGSGSTQYYNINLKNFDNITWSTGSADPSWNEQTGTATGSISFTIPHVTGDSSVKNYVYQYTLPTGYTETETRYANESRTGAEEATLAVNNKLFFNIHETEQGGAILLKVDKNSSPFSYTDTIKSDFINNFTSHTYGGGAVAISGKTIITSIIGNFIGNVASAENAGALNIGTSQTIDNIIGNFIANRSEGTTTTSSSSIGGGAIYTKDGDRNSITGDFIGNSAVKNAGAIYHTSKTIGTITGDFIANVAGENGGAIYTYANSTAKINNIIGDFINNQAGGSGGAIYVGGGATYGSIRGSFLGNIAASYGGAIYVNSNANISIDATDKNIVFYNNKAGENYSDIYNNGGTISLNAATGQKISFGGTLRAASGTININNKDGVQGGTYVFNNTVSKNSVNLYNGAKLILGKITQTNGDITYGNFNQIASLITDNNGGEIDQRNEHIDSNTIDTVTLGSGSLKYSIDIDGTTKTADKITTSESTTSSGIITLEAINLIGGFESLTPEDVIQIINNKNASSTLKLQLGSDLQGDVLLKTIEGSTTDETITSTTAWNKIYQRTIISDTEIYGQIALKTKVTEDDSIGITTYTSGGEESTESMGDTLMLVNQDTTNTIKDFTATTDGDSYTVMENLGATKGTININGISGGDAETINLNGNGGFQVGEGATALNFNNVTVGGAATIATITNGNATVGINNGIINGSIIGDTVFNMTTSGTSELNGSVTNANITNTGNLTTTAENIANSSITNSSNLYLSGALAQSIAGTGTTYVNSTLSLNNGAEIAGTLNVNNGTITVSNGNITTHTIGAMTGNGNLNIDLNLAAGTVDSFNLTNTSSGTLTLSSVNFLGTMPTQLDNDFSVQVLNTTGSSTIQLALSAEVAEAFDTTEYIIGTTGEVITKDNIQANTAWNKIYQEHITTASTDYGKLALSDDKQSIEVVFTRSDGGTSFDASLGDTLMLVNQDTTNATKDFTATTDGDSYTVTEDLGATKGTVNINGVSGGDAETINLDGHSGFQVGEDATALNFNNVTVGGVSTIATITNGNATVGINNSIINGSIIGDTIFNMTTSGTSELNGTFTNANITNTGNLTTNNSTIDSSVVNSGTINLVNSIINGDITNNGTLNLNGTAIENAISSTNNAGIINVNSDWTIANTVSGNTININNSTLKVGSNYLDDTDTINANNSTIDIGANTVNLKSMQLDSSSTLSLKINGLEDGQHGLLNISDNITINDGAKLTATLAQGIKAGEVTLIKADSHTGDFADDDVTHTEEGIDVAENNMYKFIKTDKFGVFSILKKSTAEDIVKEQGARAWVADAARAWVDEQPFDQGSSSAIVADKLAGLAQHDAAGLVRNLKALAPTETAVVQNTVSEKNSILFRAVDSYLRRAKEFSGISTDIETTGINAWAKPYTNNSKIYNRNGIDGSNSDSHGIIFGLEKELGSIYKLGAGVQIDRTDIDAMSRDIDVNSVTGFIYGEYKPNRYFINGIISYEQSNYKEKKYALDDIYNARYDVWVASIASMAGYQFEYLTPEAGFRYYHIKRDRYTDTAGQKVSAADTDILRGIISLRFAREIYNIKSEAYFGLTYDFMTDKNNTHVNLANGSSYTVSGSKLPRLGYETILSLEKSLTENTSAGLTYMGAYRSGYQEHTGMLNFRYEFE